MNKKLLSNENDNKYIVHTHILNISKIYIKVIELTNT